MFDHGPQTQAKPCLVIGEARVGEWGASDSNGQELRITITAYSDKRRGRSSVKALHAQVCQRLHHANDIEVPGFDLNLLHFLDSDSAREGDGVTHEANARYRVLVDGE